jgi:hypothetical protein
MPAGCYRHKKLSAMTTLTHFLAHAQSSLSQEPVNMPPIRPAAPPDSPRSEENQNHIQGFKNHHQEDTIKKIQKKIQKEFQIA